jgi:hypothetical protein
MRAQFITTRGKNLAAQQRRRNGRFVELQRGAMRASTDDLLKEARNLSAKRYMSLKEMRRQGHPYARLRFAKRLRVERKGLPAPSFVVNYQRGDFFRGWKTLVREGGKTFTGTLYNIAKHSKFMNRTKYMIKRPILTEAARRVRMRMFQRFGSAKRRAEMSKN